MFNSRQPAVLFAPPHTRNTELRRTQICRDADLIFILMNIHRGWNYLNSMCATHETNSTLYCYVMIISNGFKYALLCVIFLTTLILTHKITVHSKLHSQLKTLRKTCCELRSTPTSTFYSNLSSKERMLSCKKKKIETATQGAWKDSVKRKQFLFLLNEIL